MCLFGFLGYREAAKYERENGRRAFGIPTLGWAIITAVSLLIGAILLHLARRSAAKQAPPALPVPTAVAPNVFGSAVPAAPPAVGVWPAPQANAAMGSFGTAAPAWPCPESPATSSNILPGSPRP
jgi:hypothetical protein